MQAVQATSAAVKKKTPALKIAPETLAMLKASNPLIETELANNPGLARFVERMDANGRFGIPAKGDASTTVKANTLWTHSKNTVLSQDPGGDYVVVVQGKGKNGWNGGDPEQGTKIVGIYRVDEPRAGSAGYAKDSKGNVKPNYSSYDKGCLWPGFAVKAHGKAGDDLHLEWAVVSLDDRGQISSGGFPWGWDGRVFDGKIGTNDNFPFPS